MSYEHIFDEIEIVADPFALCELHGKCDLGLGRGAGATLHYILAGRGEIIFQGRKPIEVERGTLVLAPALEFHTLRSYGERGNPLPVCQPAELELAQHLGGRDEDAGQSKMLALCSHVSVGLRGVNDLVSLVREPMVERVGPESSLAAPVAGLLAELSAPSQGSKAMIRALLLQCMIQLLRARLQAGDPALGWMTALKDERLWSALRLMLDEPGQSHTVDSLAQAAGTSRSSFAQRFAAAYGSGPMKLLRNLRMNMAGSLLMQSDLPVKRIAELTGFRSRSAFTRTFEESTGLSPRSFRAEAKNNGG